MLQSIHVSFLFRRSNYLPSSREQLNKNEVVMLNVQGADLGEVDNRTLDVDEAGGRPPP